MYKLAIILTIVFVGCSDDGTQTNNLSNNIRDLTHVQNDIYLVTWSEGESGRKAEVKACFWPQQPTKILGDPGLVVKSSIRQHGSP